MVYKKYIKVNGKLHGPYYYESYRENNVVKKRYLGTSPPRSPLISYLLICTAIIAAVLIFVFAYNNITGKSIGDEAQGNVPQASEQSNPDVGQQDNANSASVVNEQSSETPASNAVETPTQTPAQTPAESQEQQPVQEENQTQESATNESIPAEPIANENASNETIANETISNETITNESAENETTGNEVPANETIIENQTITNETISNETIANETIVEQNATNMSIVTTRGKIRLGQPVRWTKNITLEAPAENVTIELPASAENVSVVKVENAEDNNLENITSLTGATVFSISSGNQIGLFAWLEKIINTIIMGMTGRAVDISEGSDNVTVTIQDNATQYTIQYETPAPTSEETKISNGKQIVISAPDELNYSDIEAYTYLPSDVPADEIHLYHVVNGTREGVVIDSYDYDSKGLVDYIEWTVPHLSSQTYELIIEISKAEHLDENRTLISDIYNSVKAQDGNWSEVIGNNEYVRVTFNQQLGSSNDITIYARSADNNSANVGIYLKDSDTKIAEIDGLSGEGMYKTYLTGMDGKNDTFDLRISGSISIDYIVDPIPTQELSVIYATYASGGASTPLNATINVSNLNETIVFVGTEIADVGDAGVGSSVYIQYNGTNQNPSFSIHDGVENKPSSAVYYINTTGQTGNQVINFTLDRGYYYKNLFILANNATIGTGLGVILDKYIPDKTPMLASVNVTNHNAIYVWFEASPSGNSVANKGYYLKYNETNLYPHYVIDSKDADTSPLTGFYYINTTGQSGLMNLRYADGSNYNNKRLIVLAENESTAPKLKYLGQTFVSAQATQPTVSVNVTGLTTLYIVASVTPQNQGKSTCIQYNNRNQYPCISTDKDLVYWDGYLIYLHNTKNTPLTSFVSVNVSGDTGMKVITLSGYNQFSNKGIVVFGLNTSTPVANTINPPEISLDTPDDSSQIKNTSVELNATIYDDINLANATIYIWNSTNNTIYNNTLAVSGTTNSSDWTYSGFKVGTYQWNVFVTNNNSLTSSEAANRTLTILDSIPPLIWFVNNTPQNATRVTNSSFEVNVSIAETNLTYVSYEFNSLNYTIYDMDLILMLNLDNKPSLGDSTSIAHDSSIYNIPYRLVNATWNTFGRYIKSIWFNGSQSYLVANYTYFGSGDYVGSNDYTLPNDTDFYAFYYQDNMTLAAWINTSGIYAGQDGRIISKGSKYYLYVGNNSIKARPGFHLSDGTNTTDISANILVNDSKWHYIVGVRDGVNASLYVDGVLYNTTVDNTTDLTNAAALLIGGGGAYGAWFNGSIDEVRVWRKAFNATEVYEMYASNLEQYNYTQWYLYVNQSQNAITGLVLNNQYSFASCAVDDSSNMNCTDQRIITYAYNPGNITSTTTINQIGVNGGIVGRGQNVTINATVTAGTNPIDKVWVIIWQGVEFISNILYQGFMALVSGIWTISVPTNSSFPIGQVNYTVYANDTTGLQVNYTSSFIMSYGCENLSTANLTYLLTNNVTSIGTCFVVTANNVTLDCSGYSINYSIGGGTSTYAVYSNMNYTTIENCTVIDGNLTAANSPNQLRHGIYLNRSSFASIINNNVTIYGNASYAIYLYLSSNNNTVTSNEVISNSSSAIYLFSSSNNTLTFNRAVGNSSTGIYLNSSSNSNVLTSNNATSSSGYGIYLFTSSNNTLISNIGYSNSSHGIYLYSSSNNTLNSNLGSGNSGVGIYLYSSSNNTLNSNTGSSTSSTGIYLDSSSNNNVLTSNNATSSSGYGIYLFTSSNNNLTSNTGSSNSSHGIFLYTASNNNVLISNTGISNITAGIYLFSYSSNNVLISNTGISNSSKGIDIYLYSNNNTLTSNTGTSNVDAGIYIYSSSNNTLTSNTGTSNSGSGIWLLENTNNTLISNNATGFSGSSYGLSIQNESGTVIRDCVDIKGVAEDVQVDSKPGTRIIILNCTYDITKEIVSGAGNTLTRLWYYRAYVNDTTGKNVSGVNVTAYNQTGDYMFNLTTDSSGFTQVMNITDYINNGGTLSHYSLYNMSAVNGSLFAIHTYNATLNQNNYNDLFTLSGVPIVTLISPDDGEILDRTAIANLNISVTSPDVLPMNITFYYNNNTSLVPLYNVTGVVSQANLTFVWNNLSAKTTYKWSVNVWNGVSNITTAQYNFTPDVEPKVMNLRAESINNTQIIFEWQNQPDMEWVSLYLGNEFVELRSITSTYDNWTINNVYPGELYNFRWQSGDKLKMFSDMHNFSLRSGGWDPDMINYTYRRLVTINHTIVGNDSDNYAVNITLNDTNFQWWDLTNWVWYPGFTHLNYTNHNDIRFVDYYNVNQLPYKVTSWDVPGEGGELQQVAPNETSIEGNINDYQNMYDGDWNTYSVPAPLGIYYFNYSVPLSALSTSMFRLYDGNWLWDVTLPLDCWGGAKLRFKSILNHDVPNIETYCQNNTDESWILLNNETSAYFYESMMTWKYATAVSITVMPQHYNDTLQANVNGVDGDYDVKMWMYYGYNGAEDNESLISSTGILSNVTTITDEETTTLGVPVIYNLNDTEGRTATGTNVSWMIDQDVNSRLMYATNPWMLGYKYANTMTNLTESFTHLYGLSSNIAKLLVYSSDYAGIINVTCSNSTFSNNYTINIAKSPVEITFLNVNYSGYLDWNVTYTENKSWELSKNSANFVLWGLATNTQYWYNALAYGTAGNSSALGTFILGTLASTPAGTIFNYSEDRPDKQITICANVTDMNSNPTLDVSIEYFNQTDTSFKETTATTVSSVGSIVCKTINVFFGENNTYRAKFVGATTGYSDSYNKLFDYPYEFFVGDPASSYGSYLDRQYCHPLPDGEANVTGKCYEEKGYREGSQQQNTWAYVETNLTSANTIHLLKLMHGYQKEGIENVVSAGTFTLDTAPDGFKYYTITGLDNSFYTLYITDASGKVVLNWTKPGLTHLMNQNRRDDNIFVSFGGTPSIVNYTLMYMKNPGVYDTSSYEWCQTQPGGNLYDCMNVEYWGTYGMSAALAGTGYDRGQFFRGGIVNGELNDSGLLQYNRTYDGVTGEPGTLINNDQRMCFSFTDYYWDESKIPTNNITNYYVRYWANNNWFSTYLGIVQPRIFDNIYLFEWQYGTNLQVRDWRDINGTEITTENDVETVQPSAFNSVYNQSLIVGSRKGFNIDLSDDRIYRFGLYTHGQWTNQQIGKYQQGFVIFNLPEALTNCSDDGLDARADTFNCTVSTNGCDITTDSDDDGLTDCQELYVYHTNPQSQDTDEDNIPDGLEINISSDPNVPDLTPPNGTVLNPLNGTVTNGTYQNFSLNVSDNVGFGNATLYIFNQTGDLYNATTIIIGHVTDATISVVVYLVEGVYHWFWQIVDLAGNIFNLRTGLNNSNDYITTIDLTAPSVNITYPGNMSYHAVTALNFSVSDENIANCTYSVDNGATNISTPCKANITGLTSSQGTNIWTVSAIDIAGNKGSSSVTFVIDTTVPLVTINSPNETLLSSGDYAVNISTSKVGMCNYSVDGGATNHTMISGNGGKEFTASVTGASDGNYVLHAYCSDLIGNRNDTERFAFSISTGCVGSGCGGGGTGCTEAWNCGSWGDCTNGTQARVCIDADACGTKVYKPNVTMSCTPVCTPNWVCDEWNPCLGGNRTRECRDINGCNTTINIPIEEEKCTGGCAPLIICGQWGTCMYDTNTYDVLAGKMIVNGTKYRQCNDADHCIENYTENMTCNTNLNIVIRNTTVCGVNTLEAVSEQTNNTVAEINLNDWAQSEKLSMLFTQGSDVYCPQCYNAVLDSNLGEKGIDCGGACKPCVPEKFKIPTLVLWAMILALWLLLILLLAMLWLMRRRKEEMRRKEEELAAQSIFGEIADSVDRGVAGDVKLLGEEIKKISEAGEKDIKKVERKISEEEEEVSRKGRRTEGKVRDVISSLDPYSERLGKREVKKWFDKRKRI